MVIAAKQTILKKIYFFFFDFSLGLTVATSDSCPCTDCDILYIEYNIIMENNKHVVTQTLWIEPDAAMAKIRQSIVSGSLVWNPFPKTTCSKFPIVVSKKTNNIDPKRPPRIVITWDEASVTLAICIPLNVKMVNIAATGNEELSESAIMCFEICVSVSKFHRTLRSFLGFLLSSKSFCDSLILPMPTRKI